jgi:hypothetical protein
MVLGRVHWVRPELLVEVKISQLDGDGLLCQVI